MKRRHNGKAKNAVKLQVVYDAALKAQREDKRFVLDPRIFTSLVHALQKSEESRVKLQAEYDAALSMLTERDLETLAERMGRSGNGGGE